MAKFVFTLYVAGETPRSAQAIATLRRLCDQELPDAVCETEIIDVIQNPALAEKDKIVATPVLIKRQPLPSRRVVGDLSDIRQVLQHLNLDAPK